MALTQQVQGAVAQTAGLPPNYFDMTDGASPFQTVGNGTASNPYVIPGGSPLMTGPDYGGMPNTPTYNPTWNSGMALAPQAQQDLSGINLNPLQQSVSNFADLADRQGPSAWATLAGQQQNQIAENTEDQNTAAAAGQTAGAMDSLASSGGLTSGARERAAEGGATNMMNMDQGTQRQNSMNQMQIGVNDAQNKMQEMGMLPGMESQALAPQFQEAQIQLGAQGQDVSNETNSLNNANSWNQNMYNQQMQAWGTNQTANATANSGGSWLCTEALKDFGRTEWKSLMKLRRFSARKDMEVTAFYIYGCKPLLDRMKERGADWNLNKKFIMRIVALTDSGEMEKAFRLYFRVIKILIDKYWADCTHPVYLKECRG